MTGSRASRALQQLEELKFSFGGTASAEKLGLLRGLGDAFLGRATEVLQLHEALCFLRAYPDDGEILGQVESMLTRFGKRRDLRRHREALINSGIAGLPIYYRFYWFTALWLAQRWPKLLHLDWPEYEEQDLLEARLPLLMTYSESLALDEVALSVKPWLDLLKNSDETDATFLVRRFEALQVDPFWREQLYEELDLPCRLDPGSTTPCRSRGRYAGAPVVFQDRPLNDSRASFASDVRRPPRSVQRLAPRKARELIDLARAAMISRQRDLDVFVHAEARDVRLMDCARGLQFACYGVVPARRQMLDAVYGFLILKSGVPMGYFLTSALYRSAVVAYNIFDTYRGAEAAHVYGRALAMVRHVFAADSFGIETYQLGDDNPEALQSGAWWFYYKLGFRPRAPEILRLVDREVRRIKKNRRYRSSIDTLRELSTAEMYLHLKSPRDDIISLISRENVGYRISGYLAEHFGADRERGIKVCAKEAARKLGLRSRKRFSAGERLAWNRWAPLVMILPGVERWSAGNRAALVQVIKAKGGPSESTFVSRFDRHRPLRHALLKLAAEEPE